MSRSHRGLTANDMPGRDKMTRAANFADFRRGRFCSAHLNTVPDHKLKDALVEVKRLRSIRAGHKVSAGTPP